MRSLMVVLVVASMLPQALAAQDRDPLARALELERRGGAAAAAEAYREALRLRPADLAALLGLERTTTSLGVPESALAPTRVALAASPALGPAWGILLRVHGLAGRNDSAWAAAERWAALEPGSEDPWRELASVALNRNERGSARRALQAGRERLGQPDALAPEMAALDAAEGRWPEATGEWLSAMARQPDYRLTALAALSRTPEGERRGVLAATEGVGPEADRLGAGLRVRWGDPLGGWEALQRGLPVGQLARADALREFAELVRGTTTREGRLAYASATEALVPLAAPSEVARLRTEAGRAYAEAGEPAAARRVLGELADGPAATSALARDAAGTVITLLLEEGRVAEAEERLAAASALPVEERAELRRRVALAWALANEGDRARRVAGSDSSVDDLALRGQVALYEGRVGEARRLLTAAGPFAGGREAGARRASLLALLQPIDIEELPALGSALRAVGRGDTAQAARGLGAVAQALGPGAGGAGVLVLAGELELARGAAESARDLFERARAMDDPASGPPALLGLARIALREGQPAEAVGTLEQLILDFPDSALVPEARRLLDEARGAVPST